MAIVAGASANTCPTAPPVRPGISEIGSGAWVRPFSSGTNRRSRIRNCRTTELFPAVRQGPAGCVCSRHAPGEVAAAMEATPRRQERDRTPLGHAADGAHSSFFALKLDFQSTSRGEDSDAAPLCSAVQTPAATQAMCSGIALTRTMASVCAALTRHRCTCQNDPRARRNSFVVSDETSRLGRVERFQVHRPAVADRLIPKFRIDAEWTMRAADGG